MFQIVLTMLKAVLPESEYWVGAVDKDKGPLATLLREPGNVFWILSKVENLASSTLSVQLSV